MKLVENLYHYDHRLLIWCSDRHNRTLLAKLAKAISQTGDGYLQIILPTIMLMIDPLQGQSFFITVALAFTIQLPIYWLLKNCLKRRRPPDVIPAFQSFITPSDQFSFPSGHSSAAFLLANLTFLFYGAMAWPLFLWASLVALSRIVLGVHFPTDIIAGITLGAVTTFVATYILN